MLSSPAAPHPKGPATSTKLSPSKEDRSMDATKFLDFDNWNEIVIILDLNMKRISFHIDGEDKGIAFEDIACGDDICYRLAVTIYDSDDSVEIVNFKCL